MSSIFTLSKMVLKSLFSKPATYMYPVLKREPIVGSRGSIVNHIDQCTFCTLCQKKCPTDAIVVDREKKTWVIEPMRCITCNACVDACPKHCLEMLTSYSSSKTAAERQVD